MTELKKYQSIDELSQSDLQLLEKAIESREQAYAPYSRFKVGTSLLLENGKVICGNNQENAAYPSGLCAERVALFAAHANYPNQKIITMAITCRHSQKHTPQPFTSCGACRQVMLEYEQLQSANYRVLFYGESGEVWELPNAKSLMPFHFDKSILE